MCGIVPASIAQILIGFAYRKLCRDTANLNHSIRFPSVVNDSPCLP